VSLYSEIFGFEDASRPSAVQKPEPPAFPWENPLWEPSAASAEICNKIENAALLKELAGDHVPERVFLGDPEALGRFRRVVPAPMVTPITPNATSDLAKSANRAGERRLAITGILNKFRTSLGMKSWEPTEGWNRLEKTCLEFVERAIAEVA
jgi:hypothetical protein